MTYLGIPLPTLYDDGMLHPLSDDLPKLQEEFPGYAFGVTRTWHGFGYVAERIGPGDGPLVIITSDTEELRRTLARKEWKP